MAKITFKTNPEASRWLKNLGVVLFNVFANFFNWFVILICLTILVSGYWWLIKPKYDFIASDQELNFREREYEDKINYLKQLNEVKAVYKSINQADKEKIDAMLSSQQDLDRLKIILLREIGQLGKERNVAVDNIAITPLDNSSSKFITIAQAPTATNPLFGKLQLVQVSFVIKNVDYDNMKKFLGRLETSLRVMDVTKISFEPSARQVAVELVTYYLQK